MIIILKNDVDRAQAESFAAELEKKGVTVEFSQIISHITLGLTGDTDAVNEEAVKANCLVKEVIRVGEPYKLAGRQFHPDDTVIEVSNQPAAKIGGANFAVIAGPCTVENGGQMNEIAAAVKKAGAAFLRGGLFKPRTSPYSFQGIGFDGFSFLLNAKKEYGLPIVTELMDINHLELFNEVDVIQVGARNMQNYPLLKELGRCRKPILLKRGPAASVTELLMSAEYIMAGGNDKIILCERGIRSFNNYARYALDFTVIPELKKKSHLPVIVDPSHATGISWMVAAMSKAAIACSADGIIVEVHNDPQKALCDGGQSITLEEFSSLMDSLRSYAELEKKII